MDITQSIVRSLLIYDRGTGVFQWKVGKRRGKQAGFLQSGGYIQICIAGRNYYAHRLAWLYEHGSTPPPLIDHIDGSRTNNRIDNLRASCFQSNGENQRRPHVGNSSRYLGVSAKNGRWRAAIKSNGKTYHIGTFDTEEDAYSAYLERKRRMHAGTTI